MTPRLRTMMLAGMALLVIGLWSCDDPEHHTNCSDLFPPNLIHISTHRIDWHQAARPVPLADEVHAGRILWHQPPAERISDVWDVDPKICSGMLVGLRMIFRPDTSDAAGPSWAGISTYIGDLGIDSTSQSCRLRVYGTHGIVHLDLGRISEDLFDDGVDRTEDANGNGVLSEDEDVGLDLLSDNLEPGYDPQSNPDPDGDNWYFQGNGKCPVPPSRCASQAFQDSLHDPTTSVYYEWINGTEGNLIDPASLGAPDQLALGSGFNVENDYVSYKIDLSSDSFLVRGSELNGWRTYAIPILDSAAIDTIVSEDPNRPFWAMATHMRVWFESHGSTVPDTLQVADWWFEK